MLSTREINHRDTETQRYRKYSENSLCLRVSVVLAAVLFVTACRQDMHDQPKYKPLRPADPVGSFQGSSARTPVEGTVARGLLREDSEFYTGRLANSNQPGATGSNLNITPPANANTATPPARTFVGYVAQFPIQINHEALDRGEERFNIYCSVCHGRAGDGRGMVALRGFRTNQMPTFHTDDLRKAPPGYFFNVMTEGLGTMPSYAGSNTAEDRWKIAAYIRALQISQGSKITELPDDIKQKMNNPSQSQGNPQGGHQ